MSHHNNGGLINAQQPELFKINAAARLLDWPGFPLSDLLLKEKREMVVELLDQLIKLAKNLRPSDRSEKARQYSILITELEKLYAYAKEYSL